MQGGFKKKTYIDTIEFFFLSWNSDYLVSRMIQTDWDPFRDVIRWLTPVSNKMAKRFLLVISLWF